MYGTTREDIDDFLAQKRLALVGISRDPKDFSRGLFRDLRRRGYDIVPVNPALTEVDGARAFAKLQDIKPPVEGALIMTAAAKSMRVAEDCAEAGITRIWFHRGTGRGAVDEAAVDFCRQRGLLVVAGFCPYMFLGHAPFVHRLHGLFMKVAGTYPAKAA
jgi:uncharacterized protein